MSLHGDNDADNEKREGHAQQQRVKITTFGEECGKDAVERGHDDAGLRVAGRGYGVGNTVGAFSNWNFAA